MFARIKKSGKYQYLQIVENRKEKGRVKQRVIATVGRMDQLHCPDTSKELSKRNPNCGSFFLFHVILQSS